MKTRYSIRRPITSEKRLPGEAMILARYHTLAAARAALARNRDAAEAQGTVCQDYIWDEVAHAVV
jgi:hypothetical protein